MIIMLIAGTLTTANSTKLLPWQHSCNAAGGHTTNCQILDNNRPV